MTYLAAFPVPNCDDELNTLVVDLLESLNGFQAFCFDFCFIKTHLKKKENGDRKVCKTLII